MPEGATLVVLISGQGRNLQALIDAIADGKLQARIAAVVSNRTDAYGLERARRAGIPTQVLSHRGFPDRESFDAALVDLIAPHRPDIVVLAGFMRILTPVFVRAFAGRMLNIHPSLLPRHPGLDTHRKALEAGDREHGATVHFVTEALDGGPAIIQGAFTIGSEDTANSLAERVMHDIEVRIFPQAVQWMVQGRLTLRENVAHLDGYPLRAPLTLDALSPEFR